jgi:hypothetical protein
LRAWSYAGPPLALGDIHRDVVAMLGPVSNGTTKKALSRMAAVPDSSVRRVARGFYTVV